MWFKPHIDWLLDALREKGGTGAEVVGAIMGDAAAIAPPHAITAICNPSGAGRAPPPG
jgi:hypothetical protein